MLFDTLALFSTLVGIILLKRLINIFPSLMACAIRWKENLNIHNSLKLRNDRNLLALAMILPFCLTTYRYDLYDPPFLTSMSEELKVIIIIGIFITYITLRTIFSLLLRPRGQSNDTYSAAFHSSRTFFIIITLGLVAIGGCASVFGMSANDAKNAMLWVSAAIYIIFILRKSQILLSSGSLFASFLYLCALEILSTGVLIASAAIF